MKEITILSGKGGAGKTSVTASLAVFAHNAVFCDNDVDAADLHLIFNPQIIEKENYISGSKAFIKYDICTNCGICADYCRFQSIGFDNNNKIFIDTFECEGCKLCYRVCPQNAINMIESTNNFKYVSNTRFGTLVHAKMGPGEEKSGKLVTKIRKKAKEIALKQNAEFVINDGPPGIGCSAISSITGADKVLIVVEPTKSGVHDMKRLIQLIDTFKIEKYAVINKSDINKNITNELEIFLYRENIPLLGKIPFDETVVKALVNNKAISEFAP